MTQDLRNHINAPKLIRKLQTIIFEDEGHPTVRDKIGAIKILLDKTVPDYQKVEITSQAESGSVFAQFSRNHLRQIAQAYLETHGGRVENPDATN